MEIVIVGAGIVGVSAARYLAERDCSVRVLDKGSVAGEASGLNGGLIAGGGWGTDPDLATTLRMGSRDRFIELHERGHDIGLDRTGKLILIRTDEEWRWATAYVEAERLAGRRSELVPGTDLPRIEPRLEPTLQGAILDPLGVRAEPVAATLALATEARAAGASIETGRPVTGLAQRSSGGWEVASGDGVIGADVVVVAAGPWCRPLGALAGLDVPVVGVRGRMWASKPQAPLLRHGIAATESVVSWAKEGSEAPPELTHRDGRRITRHLYGRQRPNGEIVFGGDRVLVTGPIGPLAGREEIAGGFDPEGIGVNHAQVAELIPAVADLPPAREWSGVMPFTLDGRALLGPIAERPGLFIAGGLASSGFGRGPMAGELVAQSVLGEEPPVDLSSVSPSGRVVELAS